MDERLKKALEMSNYIATLNNQKQIASEKFQESLILYQSGSKITVSQSLIAFCSSLVANGQTDVIIVDDNNMPVKIDNLGDFSDNILELYNNAAQEYFNQIESLKKQRSVEKLIEYEQ